MVGNIGKSVKRSILFHQSTKLSMRDTNDLAHFLYYLFFKFIRRGQKKIPASELNQWQELNKVTYYEKTYVAN